MILFVLFFNAPKPIQKIAMIVNFFCSVVFVDADFQLAKYSELLKTFFFSATTWYSICIWTRAVICICRCYSKYIYILASINSNVYFIDDASKYSHCKLNDDNVFGHIIIYNMYKYKCAMHLNGLAFLLQLNLRPFKSIQNINVILYNLLITALGCNGMAFTCSYVHCALTDSDEYTDTFTILWYAMWHVRF